MNKRTFLDSHSKICKIVLLLYIVFGGCFAFPFRNEYYPFSILKAYIFLVLYISVGKGLKLFYGEKKKYQIYIISFILTLIGMLFRYLLEYGEVSNTINFTAFNIISYLIIVPVFVLGVYNFSSKSMKWL